MTRSLVFTPIHRALGLEAGNATIDLIQQAVDHGVEETADLDWKQAVYNSRKPNWDEEAAKDIAAMANSGGGWIVFGVKESGGTNAASEIAPIGWSAAEQQRILRTAYAKIGPPVVGIEFYNIPCGDEGDGSVVMMRVPDSADAPHFARKGDNAFVAPRRNGPHTVYMSDREIERGFRERFQYADDREHLLQDRFERACEALRPEDGVFLAVAAVPLEPVTGRGASAMEQVYQYRDEPLLPAQVGVRAQNNWWQGGEIKKGLRQWILRAHKSAHHKFRKFLCDDAAVLGAYQLGLLITDEQWSDKYPVGLTNHCRAVDVQTAVIDCVTLLRSHAEERQAHGGFRIRVGLVGIAGKPIVIREMDDWVDRLRDADDMEPIVRFQPITIELDPLSMIDEILPIINDLVWDLVSQGGVEYL
jgi:divergent AAA domain protein